MRPGRAHIGLNVDVAWEPKAPVLRPREEVVGRSNQRVSMRDALALHELEGQMFLALDQFPVLEEMPESGAVEDDVQIRLSKRDTQTLGLNRVEAEAVDIRELNDVEGRLRLYPFVHNV